LSSLQLLGFPTQRPFRQTAFSTQRLWASQNVPSAKVVSSHLPVSGLKTVEVQLEDDVHEGICSAFPVKNNVAVRPSASTVQVSEKWPSAVGRNFRLTVVSPEGAVFGSVPEKTPEFTCHFKDRAVRVEFTNTPSYSTGVLSLVS
jgi:hypothetical protein